MAEDQLELVVRADAMLGEGPLWDNNRQMLYWLDIIGKNVHIYDPQQGTNRTIHVNQCPGAMVLGKSGNLVLAMERGFYSLDLFTERLVLLTSVLNEPISNRFNDGKCDAMGRFWAGTLPLRSSEPEGSLYCLENDLFVRYVFNKVYCSNGIAWSVDNRTMYYIDSLTRQVVAFDYNLDQGTIKDKRTVVVIPDEEGLPDGMTIDSEGMLWVAQWGGYKVSRWNPQNGERIEIISVPAAQVTSCTFGGKYLDELYITTARAGLDEKALSEQPFAGGVFRIKTNTKGMETNAFNC